MSLRERQKRNRRDNMLDAARSLFHEKSYAKTTIDAIAEKAEVGVATVYNYFGTKEGILAAVAYKDSQWIRRECDKVVENPPDDPAEAVKALFEPYNEARKLATVEMISAYLEGAKQGDGPFHDIAVEINRWRKRQIHSVLSSLVDRGVVTPNLSIDDATSILLAMFNDSYNQAQNKTKAQATKEFNAMLKRLPTLFECWRAT